MMRCDAMRSLFVRRLIRLAIAQFVFSSFITQAIVNQVLFQERSNLMDQAAYEDAETSLQNMIRDFVSEDRHGVDKDLR